MHKQLFWLGSLVTAGILMVTVSATAQTNQSDTSGSQNYSAPTTTVDTGNRASGSGSARTLQYNSATGMVTGGGLSSPIFLGFGNSFGTASGTGSGSPTTEVTLNQISEALQKNLQQSLDNLAAAEDQTMLADSGPRRITRRSASEAEARECVNPVYEARQMAERQLKETKKFIEQVNQIEPDKNLW
ncbi:MAG: hypothetical protein ACFCU7_18250 [Pleurocapsa sp.]